MRKRLLIATIATVGLIGSAYAQPSTNGPSGTGPEGRRHQQRHRFGFGNESAGLEHGGARFRQKRHEAFEEKTLFVILDLEIRQKPDLSVGLFAY
jgi:hypothetical protein